MNIATVFVGTRKVRLSQIICLQKIFEFVTEIANVARAGPSPTPGPGLVLLVLVPFILGSLGVIMYFCKPWYRHGQLCRTILR